MAKRGVGEWWASNQSAPVPKHSKNHRISESEPKDYSDDESTAGAFGDPNSFLQQFGGYASDQDEHENENSDDQQGMD
jgi:hypothetical protein